MKHTPGPWRLVTFHDGLSVVAENEDSIFDFAGAGSEGEPWWEETLANARLCAVAPELLSALEEVVADLDAYVEKFGGRCDSIENARSLISRLRSEEE